MLGTMRGRYKLCTEIQEQEKIQRYAWSDMTIMIMRLVLDGTNSFIDLRNTRVLRLFEINLI